MDKRIKHKPKIMYLQEDMNLMSEFDLKIFQFMNICQKHDVKDELGKWFRKL